MPIADIFIKQLAVDPKLFFIMTLVVVFSICCHEYCHAQMALWMGDSTAADRGHLTLNPMKQMGILSLIMFLLLGFAWGSVPVDPRRLRSKYRYGELLTSLAGPAANLILFLTGWTAFGLLAAHDAGTLQLLQMVLALGTMNCIMLLFNLLPVPGLDGWNIFLCLFPKVRVPNSETVKGIMIFLMLSALCCTSWLFRFSYWIMSLSVDFFSR